MKLVGKSGKRQVNKKAKPAVKSVEKKVRQRSVQNAKTAQSDQKDIARKQETPAIEQILAEELALTKPDTEQEITNEPPQEFESDQILVESDIAQTEQSIPDDIPQLTKTPAPPIYLRPAARVPINENMMQEAKTAQSVEVTPQKQVSQPKTTYTKKTSPKPVIPLLQAEMPERDPQAPRSHVNPLSDAERQQGVRAHNEQHQHVIEQSITDPLILVEPSENPIKPQDGYGETRQFTPQNKNDESENQTRKTRKKKKQEISTKNIFTHEQNTKRSKVRAIAMPIVMLVLVGAVAISAYFWWETTVFEYNLRAVVALEGANVSPSAFLYNGEGISAFFRDEAPLVPGRQTVSLALRYGLRTQNAVGVLYVLTPISDITIELAEEGPDLIAVEMLTNAEIARGVPFEVRFLQTPRPLSQYTAGEHTLTLELNGARFSIMLNVIDTTPPTATPVSRSIYVGEEISPEDFVTDVYDASQIASIEFVTEPDVSVARDMIIEVVITDEFENSYTVAVTLSIIMPEPEYEEDYDEYPYDEYEENDEETP